jgi:hypothetical protein
VRDPDELCAARAGNRSVAPEGVSPKAARRRQKSVQTRVVMRVGSMQSVVFFAMPLVVALVAHAMATFFGSCVIHSAQQREIESRRALLERAASLRQDIAHARWVLSQRTAPTGPSVPDQTEQGDVPEREWLKRLEDLQHEMASLTSELRRLSQLQEEVDRKRRTRENLKEETDQLDTRIAEANKKLDAVRKQLADTVRQYGTPTPTVVAIDHDAVFIECDAAGASIIPDGTRLSSQATLSEQNLLRKSLRERGAAFFLVRPDGADSFQLYRRIVQGFSMDTSFGRLPVGYEPIPSTAKITLERKDGKIRLVIGYRS